jgi:hypothetical protein
MRPRVGVVGILVVAIGCAKAGPPTEAVTLTSVGRSGRSMRPIQFTEAPPGLALSYETDLKVSDREALRKEATEIWQDFRVDADRAKVQSAIIMANEKATGFIVTHNNSYNFVFERRGDGSWPNEATLSK